MIGDKEIKNIFLKPCEIYFSSEAEVSTLLGSCVSICFYDPHLKAGAICHYMLPLWNGQGLQSPKYGNIAVLKCLALLAKNGSRRNDIIAKIFGGGRVINTENDVFNIGDRNVQTAYELLKQENIKILGASTGGNYGRKIIFNTQTGLVKMKFIKKQGNK